MAHLVVAEALAVQPTLLAQGQRQRKKSRHQDNFSMSAAQTRAPIYLTPDKD